MLFVMGVDFTHAYDIKGEGDLPLRDIYNNDKHKYPILQKALTDEQYEIFKNLV